MNAQLQTPSACPIAPPSTQEPLIGKSLEELRSLVKDMGEPAFRADQLHQWLYVHCVRNFDDMSNLKKSFRDKLAETHQVGSLSIAEKQVSQDGTTKYLFRLPDGKVVESVLMYFEERGTYALCLSTQVGCAVNCGFCATGKLGFMRNLSVAEIVEQYVYAQADSGKEVRNIVFMGQGEPMLNYDTVLQAIHILNKSAEVGMRHITISTSGIVPRIYDLAKEDMQLTLAISLHAPDNATREAIMPLNKKWPLEELMPALHHYVSTTGKRLTIEYILLAGVNDQPGHAHDLGKLLQGLKCNVNLIPYNPIGDAYGYKRPSGNAIHRFKDIVTAYGKKVTVRVERGVDIAAACGQLANKVQPV
ncbi:MAG: rRNA ((2503)-C(2))-methyltransferase [Vampirovibrio sp.]|jgi:23S rRNA (adenine2503-C2)-methyltransferase|nr:rRNA ((2503)-C(2))-methyltransferase [Vampirovibrio sp.]